MGCNLQPICILLCILQSAERSLYYSVHYNLQNDLYAIICSPPCCTPREREREREIAVCRVAVWRLHAGSLTRHDTLQHALQQCVAVCVAVFVVVCVAGYRVAATSRPQTRQRAGLRLVRASDSTTPSRMASSCNTLQ